jgi:hypothetical protein
VIKPQSGKIDLISSTYEDLGFVECERGRAHSTKPKSSIALL